MENFDQSVMAFAYPAIRYTIKRCGLTGFSALLGSWAIGIILSMAYGYLAGNDWKWAIAVGIIAGFFANSHHDNLKK